MIVKMKHLDLLCVASEREETLSKLRDLGVMHIDLSRAKGVEVIAAKGEISDAEKALLEIAKARKALDGVEAEADGVASVAAVLELAENAESLKGAIESVEREIAKYAPYGDFDPELAKKILAAGVKLDGIAELPDPLPTRRLSEMSEELERKRSELGAIQLEIASANDVAIRAEFPGLADRAAFSAAKELLEARGEIAAIEGWVPVTALDELAASVKANGWGSLVRDPAEGEEPPTLIQPPKLFRPVTALFKGLGIAPGYYESDVSVPFMCYFSIFFAMLVGDGAYGTIMLVATLWAWRKAKSPAARPWGILMTVFSLATIAWGALSNTWFGCALPCFDSVVSRWLGDETYYNMIFLSITIGATHLILARVWNGLCMLNSLSCLAQFGWAGILLGMYWITCTIVGIFTGGMPCWFYPVFITSILLVFLFTVPVKELGKRGVELGMLPLNIMSTLGDVISYVRLFAVGLASVQLAKNFNQMAIGFLSSENALWVNALCMLATVAILLIGHGLNLAMAGLSILVHAVRLNTLEFSNHKGISWAGYDFNPFKKH